MATVVKFWRDIAHNIHNTRISRQMGLVKAAIEEESSGDQSQCSAIGIAGTALRVY